MPRVFVALALGDQSRKAVSAQINRLRPLSKAVTWTPPANLHLTLRFLGDQTDEQLSDVLLALQEAADGVPGFTMGLRNLRTFPDLEHPHTRRGSRQRPRIGIRRRRINQLAGRAGDSVHECTRRRHCRRCRHVGYPGR